MTLAETLRAARLAVDAPHPDGYISENTSVSRKVLRDLIDEITIRKRGQETLSRDVLVTPTLRDQFAMHAPLEPLPESLANNSAERNLLRNRTRVAYAYADFMLAARTARVERTS